MNIFTSLMMKSSALVLNDDQNFPMNPSIGQFCFLDGVLYIYATIDSITSWVPLTNKTLYYVHVQAIPAISWSVNHGLGSQDLIYMVYDSNAVIQLTAEIQFIDENNITLDFTEVTAGKAVIFAAGGVTGSGGSNSNLVVGAGLLETNDMITIDPATVITRNIVNITADYSASSWDEIYADSSEGPFEIVLPRLPNLGDQVKIIDIANTFNTNNVTVTKSSGVCIKGLDEDLILDVSGITIALCWTNDPITGWTF